MNLLSSVLSPRLGAAVLPGGGVRFCVWAPDHASVEVEVYDRDQIHHEPLDRLSEGFFSGQVASAGHGTRYRYRLDQGPAFPDPASRSQPEGPHGPSEVVDPALFEWNDEAWSGLDRDSLVIYELHVGTFSPHGTFEGIIPQLQELKELGVSAIELMPVAEFPGRWNWGYDGVDLYAPSSVYGGPSGLQRLVDAAHQVGLGVLLDVVYNHFGPDGNYLRAFAKDYFTDRHHTPWGDAVNYDGPNSRWVRQFVLQNVHYWLDEYHVDGLRLDATHAIVDESPRHLLADIAEVAQARPRPAIVIAEDHRNLVHLFDPPSRGGYGLDGVWADDFHHALRTYLLPIREGYYRDYAGSLSEVARAVEQGFVFQGQVAPVSRHRRGTPVTDQPGRAFVFCTENHDQVGNRAFGERLNHLVDRPSYVLASAALLLSPETPLLFQGQEFAASTPFLYFTDHHPELGRLVTEGRRREFAAFAAFADPAQREAIPDPQAEATFQRSRLRFEERETNEWAYQVYRDLLRLRRTDPVLREPDRLATRASAPAPHLLAVYRRRGGDHRLVLLNFGRSEARLRPSDLPGDPPQEAAWEPRWWVGEASTAGLSWGGQEWRVPAGSGVVLAAVSP